jgi:predicted alpha/beta superfamily hydrolase
MNPSNPLTPARRVSVRDANDPPPGNRPARIAGPGSLRHHRFFPSLLLGNARTLVVYLPPGYDADIARRYPVFYLHDGQNVFEAATSAFGVEWEADDTATRLIHEGQIPPLIMVGIYNTPDRINEYTLSYDRTANAGGKGKVYGRFVMEEVKPFIDKTYRTLKDREHTAVGGSSLGGLITLGMARFHHEQISMAAIMSPSLWWGRCRILGEIARDYDWMKSMRFWLDMGTRETGRRRGRSATGITSTGRSKGASTTKPTGRPASIKSCCISSAAATPRHMRVNFVRYDASSGNDRRIMPS